MSTMNYSNSDKPITFQEYIGRVINGGTARSEELKVLLKLYTIKQLENYIDGDRNALSPSIESRNKQDAS